MFFIRDIVRFALIVFNVILALAGLSIFIAGITVGAAQNSEVKDVAQGKLSTAGSVASIVGVCVLVFAFIGVWGALRMNRCICIYAGLLLILILMEVGAIALAFTYKAQAEEMVTNKIREIFTNYLNETASRGLVQKYDGQSQFLIDDVDYENAANAKEWVDKVQQALQCCGTTDNNSPWSQVGVDAPASCYPEGDTSKPKFAHGCAEVMSDMVQTALSIVSHLVIVTGTVELVAFACSVYLSFKI